MAIYKLLMICYTEIRQEDVLMNEEQYYEEIEHLVTTYWNIGKILVEAQEGFSRAKYGNELIKKWSVKLTKLYGHGYSITNLKLMRKFYTIFQKGHPLGDQLTWSHHKELIPVKDENKRNYYINLCINNNLSKRELINEIKSNSYERLIDKPEKIEIELPKKYLITTNMKNPIIVPVSHEIKTEHDLELNVLANLDFFFKQLGEGFTYAGHQYKIIEGNHNYYIDILLST